MIATPDAINEALRSIDPERAELTTEWVEVSRIFVDPLYQRNVHEPLVRHIAETFDPKAMHVVVLSRRPGGSLAVIDGNHRILALKRRFTDDFRLRVEAKVLNGLTREQEAELFVKLNGNQNRKKTTDRDEFRAALAAHDPESEAIVRMVEDAGLTLNLDSKSTTDARHIMAVSALRRIVHQGGDLRVILRMADSAWPDDHRAHAGFMLSALHWFLRRYAGMFSEHELLDRLSQISINTILQKASQFRPNQVVSRDDALGRALLDIYNARRRSGALPAWDAPEIVGRMRSEGTKLGKARSRS